MKIVKIGSIVLSLMLLFSVVVFAEDSQIDPQYLIYAATHGDSKSVAALLHLEETDVNIKDNMGVTALMGAVSGGYIEIVGILLEKGADVNAKDNEGKTALMMAEKYKYTEIVNMLKKAGAKE